MLVHYKGKAFSFRNKGFAFFVLAFITSFFSFLPSVSAFDLNSTFSSEVSLTAFIVLGVLALVLLVIGLGVPLPYFSVVGFFVLFVLGGFLQAGSLMLPTGATSFVYGDNYSAYHYDDYNGTINPSLTDLNLFHEVKEFQPFDNRVSHLVGLFLMFISAMGFIFGAFASFGQGGGF